MQKEWHTATKPLNKKNNKKKKKKNSAKVFLYTGGFLNSISGKKRLSVEVSGTKSPPWDL
jgi:hypothetical protein